VERQRFAGTFGRFLKRVALDVESGELGLILDSLISTPIIIHVLLAARCGPSPGIRGRGRVQRVERLGF
jgi:hypothetical protein